MLVPGIIVTLLALTLMLAVLCKEGSIGPEVDATPDDI
jgi:hypothetical protein